MRQTTLNLAGSVALCDVGAAADSYGVLLMCRTQCMIDQSCMKLEVVAKNKDSKLCLRFERGLHRQVLAQIIFLLFLRDNSPAYDISL